MAGAIGNNDPRVSDFRKCWIQGMDGTTVCGVYGAGTSREITSNWIQPFAGESIGGKIPAAAGGLAQSMLGMTSVTSFNSRQTWEANQPTAFTLELLLYALEDAAAEVMLPLRTLEQWIAPETLSLAGLASFEGGKIPSFVLLNIGTKVIYKDCVINSMSLPFDKEVDSRGNFVRATVSMQLSTLTMVDRQMLGSGDYGITQTEIGHGEHFRCFRQHKENPHRLQEIAGAWRRSGCG